jgi:hypothetical protein
MAEPVRHRQTKGAATDMFDLQLPRHTSTLPTPAAGYSRDERLLVAVAQPRTAVPVSANSGHLKVLCRASNPPRCAYFSD